MQEDQRRENIIQQLAGANYGPREIAIYLGENTRGFLNAWEEKNSPERQAYDRGILMTQANIDMALSEQAKAGNVTAAQQHKKSAREQEWRNTFNPEGR